MKIKVEKWILDSDFSYKILGIEKCCDKLTKSKNISVNTELDDNELYVDDHPEYSVKMIRTEDTSYDEYCNTTDYYEKINFCPFCGEKILIEVINEVDKSEEYSKLKKQSDALCEKCNKTDSKKRERELQSQLRELGTLLNEMRFSDDFSDENIEEKF